MNYNFLKTIQIIIPIILFSFTLSAQTKTSTKSKPRLQFIEAHNGGFIAYFDNGDYVACPRCDFDYSAAKMIQTPEARKDKVLNWGHSNQKFDSKNFNELYIGKDLRDMSINELINEGWVMVDYIWLVDLTKN